jgi:hypothetical protein
MKLFLKILAVFFAIGFIGNLIAGRFLFIGIILSGVCAYYGWKDSSAKDNGSDLNNKEVNNDN